MFDKKRNRVIAFIAAILAVYILIWVFLPIIAVFLTVAIGFMAIVSGVMWVFASMYIWVVTGKWYWK